MFGLFKKPEEEVVAVFDIGNGSIGVAYVMLSKHNAPTILYTHREPISYLPEVSSDRLLSNTLKLLKSVATHLQKEGSPRLNQLVGRHHVRHAYCTYSSPWYVSQTKLINVSDGEPFVVTRNLIDNVVKKEEQAFTEAMKEGKYVEMFGPDATLMERRIIHTRLNGYEVANPFGKQVKEVEISFFSSFISQTIIEKVEQVLHSTMHFSKVHHGSYALSSWSAVQDMFPNVQDFLFLDISNEVTDVVLSYQGVLSQTTSFPIGRSSILRTMVDELSVTPEVAQSYISVQAKSIGEKEFSEKINSIINRVVTVWFEEFVMALEELENSYTLPRQVFVTADTDLSSAFVTQLKKPLAVTLSIPQNSFNVTLIAENIVRPFVSVQQGVQYDPFLSLESTFLNKIAV